MVEAPKPVAVEVQVDSDWGSDSRNSMSWKEWYVVVVKQLALDWDRGTGDDDAILVEVRW